MTILGFILGFFMCILIFFQFYIAALALLILNRFCDGLDGTMARLTTPTPLGGYLDIVSDFTIYSGFVLAFGFSNSSYTHLSMVLLFCIIVCNFSGSGDNISYFCFRKFLDYFK